MTKVLYVEDEPFLAKIVKESLESRGFSVIHIKNGSNAIEAFQKESPDISVLDIMLPNINGYELARRIRQYSTNHPIIFLTAKSQMEDLVEGFNSGGNDYLKKPFSVEELIVRMNNLLDIFTQSKKEQLADIPLGRKFIFIPHRYVLIQNGKEQKLSHKESIILKELCKNLNGVTQRSQILMKAWGDDSYHNSRSLDVYINKIRNYFQSDDGVQIITLKGVGYQFISRSVQSKI